MTVFEKLGEFYLGREMDSATLTATDRPLLYDAKDLTTHAVCLGMTGSGKTGLGIALIEEAILDGIPALIIDPKGDIGNLLLTFPGLSPEEFSPWVDEAEAARKGLSVEAFAEKTATLWKNGLEKWGEDGARIGRLKAAGDFTIYTPGSKAGMPLSILSSLEAPPPGFADDVGAMRDRVSAAVSGLLALAGIDADPLQSREHILLSTLVDREWRAGRGLDLAAVIHGVQDPGLDRIGILPLDSFFPEKDRFALAMRLNNLVASPGFAAWAEGERLDVQRLLYTKEGRPRVSVLSIAHLGDAERMFFVTVLLNEVLAWTRRQEGTSSLRALLYMDEIFGYFPPSANPPSKAPMLTLLKQARAFGLGVVLSTQNPVDLDYRGLSNTGTWFIGRLQTERDKMRVVEGLTGVAAGEGLDRAELERLMANLGSRVFLMRNVHEDAPVLFESRWCLSYLRGPLSQGQVRTLMADKKAAMAAPVPSAATVCPAIAPVVSPTGADGVAQMQVSPGGFTAAGEGTRTVLPASIRQVFLRSATGQESAVTVRYRPELLGTARVHYMDLRRNLDEWRTVRYRIPVEGTSGAPRWCDATPETAAEDAEPVAGARFDAVPTELSNPKRYREHEKDFKAFLSEACGLELYSAPECKLTGAPDENEGDFRVRVAQRLREMRDEAIEKLRKKTASRLNTLEERIRKAEARVENEKKQLSMQQLRAKLSFGTSILSVMLGRKSGALGRVSTGIGSLGRAGKEKLDIQQATANLEATRKQRADLEAELERAMEEVRASYDVDNLQLESVRVAPRRSDTDVQQLALAWVPVE